MKRIKPKTEKYGWRTYIESSLEKPVKRVAFEQNKEVRVLLSEIIRNGLPEVKN